MTGFIIEAQLTARRAAPAPQKAVEPSSTAPRKWWRHLLWPELPPAQLAAIERELGPWRPLLCPYDYFVRGEYLPPLRALCPLLFVFFVQATMFSLPADVAMLRDVAQNAMGCQDCLTFAAVKPSRELTVVRADPVTAVLVTLPLIGTVAIPGVVVSSF